MGGSEVLAEDGEKMGRDEDSKDFHAHIMEQ